MKRFMREMRKYFSLSSYGEKWEAWRGQDKRTSGFLWVLMTPTLSTHQFCKLTVFFFPQFFGHATQHARSQFPNQGLNLYPLQKKKSTESKTTGPPGKFLKTHRLWEHTYQFFTQHWSQGPWIQVYMISMRRSIMEINENSYLRLDPRIGLNLVKRHSIKMPKGPLGDLWILFLDLGAFRAFLCLRWAGAGQLFWN